MEQTQYVYAIIGLAFFAANLPFAVPSTLRQRRIPLLWRIFLLLALYLLVGSIGLSIESHLGKTSSQSWEFYVVTFALFVTFAFPSFVYRYLLR